MNPLWLVPFCLVVDQASKYLVTQHMYEGQSIPVLGDFFRLTFIYNTGAAFGFNLGNPFIHLVASLAALGLLLWMFRTASSQARLLRFSLCLILGGALGNIVDRVYLLKVIDFFDVGFDTWRWPVFNMADSFVSVGIVLLALAYGREKEAEKEGAAESVEA